MSVVINRPDRFPVGTVVGIYPAANEQRDGKPSGTAITTATVASDGSLTFTGLTEGVPYVAYALVGSANRYVHINESHFVAGKSWQERVEYLKANPV